MNYREPLAGRDGKMKNRETISHYNNSKQEYINSIMGLKAICCILLFWWHSTIPNPAVDLGARTCEFLFVASGFLVGYNSFYKNVPDTWEESWRCVERKLIIFWPLHLITMLLVWFVIYSPPHITKRHIFTGILNLLLLQSWSPYSDIYFSFNGVSWFLSALMFCYFLSPLFLKLAKKLWVSIFLFFNVLVIRYIIEYIMRSHPNEYWLISIHTSPLVRSLEFFLGMLMVPLFMCLKERFRKISIVGITAVEAVTLLGLVYLSICYNRIWLRSTFVALMCLTVFVFGFDKGFLSHILACKGLRRLSNIQFEFFMLHQVCIRGLDNICKNVFGDWRLANAILFLFIIFTAII